jgi:hypothetical protein
VTNARLAEDDDFDTYFCEVAYNISLTSFKEGCFSQLLPITDPGQRHGLAEPIPSGLGHVIDRLLRQDLHFGHMVAAKGFSMPADNRYVGCCCTTECSKSIRANP